MTRGPDPHVLLRDSGIPWLGEIPAHWAATRLKFVAEVQGGLTLGKNYGAATLRSCAKIT
jgi:type I restriction enzyme, S subunit